MGSPQVRARLIAFYLPQFHPIPENDEWWGPGFTEWTNVARARPLYKGHAQPHIPGELGFYDLRLPETRAAQARLARDYGIGGFCYWHYWFGGRRLLERPFQEVLQSGEPDFPFCLAWANESWSGAWHGRPDHILLKQEYPGDADYAAHFAAVLPALRDPRYIRVDGRPLFIVYKPANLPDAPHFTRTWRRLAEQAGLPGLYLLGLLRGDRTAREFGLDGRLPLGWPDTPSSSRLERFVLGMTGRTLGQLRTAFAFRINLGAPGPRVAGYDRIFRRAYVGDLADDRYPMVFPCWDNTPRSGRRGYVLHGSTPRLFAGYLEQAIAQVAARSPDKRLVFIKSWNEWAEGNYLEPDTVWGRAYLEAIRSVAGSVGR